MKKLTPRKYKDLSERATKVSVKIEEAKPEDMYMVVYRNFSIYSMLRDWEVLKFITLEDAEAYMNNMTNNGIDKNLEIYVTEIIKERK